MTTYPKPLTIRLSDSMHRYVKARAKKGQTKMSEVVRSIVLEAKEREEAEKAAK